MHSFILVILITCMNLCIWAQTAPMENRMQDIEAKVAAMQAQIDSLQEALKIAQSEIERLKLQLAATSKPEPAIQGTQPSDKAELPNPEIVEPAAYTNPEVRKYALQLRSPNSSIRIGAVLRLSQIEAEEATMALISGLRDEDITVKILCCKALGKRQAKQAISDLLDLMLHENAELRTITQAALQQITKSPTPFPCHAPLEERKKSDCSMEK